MRQDLLDFEAEFAKFVGTKFAVGVANGSDALNIAIKVLGIGTGDEVITVSHTFIATVAAVLMQVLLLF
jgi:dTDP-4-amino-4,6-dideoxygalactose transaminase